MIDLSIYFFSKEMINSALTYYFLTAAEKIKHFVPALSYHNFSEEKEHVIYFTEVRGINRTSLSEWAYI